MGRRTAWTTGATPTSCRTSARWRPSSTEPTNGAAATDRYRSPGAAPPTSSTTRSCAAASRPASRSPRTTTATSRRACTSPRRSSTDGVRWSAARAYLRPAAGRPNLTVLTRAMVEKIVVRDGAAAGIAVRAGGEHPVHRRQPGGDRLRRRDRQPETADALRHRPGRRAHPARDHGHRRGRRGRAATCRTTPGSTCNSAPPTRTRSPPSCTCWAGPSSAREWLLARKGLGTTNFFETGAFLRTRDDVEHPNMQYEFLPLTRQADERQARARSRASRSGWTCAARRAGVP